MATPETIAAPVPAIIAKPAVDDSVRWLPPEASPEGCATGECLPEIEPQAGPEPKVAAIVPTRPLAERWRSAVDAVRKISPRHGASLASAKVLSLDEGRARISFGPKAQFHRATVSGESGRPTVEKALSAHLGQLVRVVIEEHTDAPGFCLSEEEARQRVAHTQGAEQSVREHPAMRSLLRVLGGEVEHIQVLESQRTPPALDEMDDPSSPSRAG